MRSPRESAPAPSPASLLFLLGGRDLEMVQIRELLEEAGARFVDRGLEWGAKASDYADEIRACLEARGKVPDPPGDQGVRGGGGLPANGGCVPVLVELEDDLGLGGEIAAGRVILVDHHGTRAGAEEATSLEQVFRLLGLPADRWNRHLELVAANDRGGVPALVEAGATTEEIEEIRAADRAAQGVTDEEERQAQEALQELEGRARGRLTIARLPHKRTAPLVDRLQPELGGPGFENLLILSPEEVNFFGTGALIRALDRRYPDGWSGGPLPERGFWGHPRPVPGIEDFLEDRLRSAG